MFFGVGKVFCLRGGEEQRELKVSQFVQEHNPNKYVYCENGSKNRSGRLNQLHLQNKIAPVTQVLHGMILLPLESTNFLDMFPVCVKMQESVVKQITHYELLELLICIL